MSNIFAAYRIPRPPLLPRLPADLPDSVTNYLDAINRYLIESQAQTQIIVRDLNQGRQRIALPAQLPSVIAADLIAGLNPRPTPEGRAVYCPDDSGGPCLAVSDGTNWLKLTLGGVIS